MTDLTYLGIPRLEIPWYPTINQDLCINCGACMEFCSNNVFKQGESSMVVANPYNCVVGCSSCLNECSSNALSFPSKEDLVKVLNNLREKHKLRS